MKARAYNIRIDIHETTPVSDGFSGAIAEPVLISSSWARIEEGTGNKATAFGFSAKSENIGLVQFNNPVIFSVRKRNDLWYNGRNLFIKYKGNKYTIQGMKHSDQEIQMFCTMNTPVEIPLIGVI